ncbi:hypothetical protein FKM82_018751 [Ascaphus truei]
MYAHTSNIKYISKTCYEHVGILEQAADPHNDQMVPQSLTWMEILILLSVGCWFLVSLEISLQSSVSVRSSVILRLCTDPSAPTANAEHTHRALACTDDIAGYVAFTHDSLGKSKAP